MRAPCIPALCVFLATAACGGSDHAPPIEPPSVAVLSAFSGDGQIGEASRRLGQPLVAILKDQSGVPRVSATVTFEVTSGGGLLSRTATSPVGTTLSTTTDEAGLAGATWLLGADTSTVQTVLVTTPSAAAPLVMSASAVKGVFLRAISGLGEEVKAGDTLIHRLTAEAYDIDGHVVPGARVRWIVTASASTVTLADSVTNASGRAAATLVAATVPGIATVNALARSGSASFANSITPGDMAVLTATPAEVILPMEGNVAQLTVTGADRFGNNIPGIAAGITMADTTVAVSGGGMGMRAVEAGTTIATLRAGTLSRDVPVTVMSFAKIYKVGGVPCGITAQGSAYCWSTSLESSNRVLQSPRTVAQLAYQGDSECLLTVAGTAQCWGPSGEGTLGGGPGITEIVRTIDDPVTVVGGQTWTQLTSGLAHVCGVASDAQAFCWGVSHLLGTDSTTAGCTFPPCAMSPVPVSGGLRFRSLASVRLFTCGVEISGDAYCWGEGVRGEVGSKPSGSCPDGRPFVCAPSPQLVLGGRKWLSVVTGFIHTCGLATDGETYCWGSNDVGQLGTNAVPPDSSTTPLRVTGGLRFQSISAGGNQACGLTMAGKAYCWGSRLTTVPTAVRPELTFSSISASNWDDDTGCGISVAGGVHCWNPPGRAANRSAVPVQASRVTHGARSRTGRRSSADSAATPKR